MNVTAELLERVREVAVQAGRMAWPARIERLKERKSAVFRVHPPAGEPRIVKRCSVATGRVEAAIYREVLARLPRSAPRLLGYAEDGDDAWLVLEDAGGRSYDARDPDDRVVAGRYLAILHDAASDLVDRVALPRRGADHYRVVTASASETVEAARSQAAWPRERISTLDDLARSIEVVADRWSEIDATLEPFPTTLVHGGFAGKNVHVRDDAERDPILAFDWEAGGWGVPVADLSAVDVASYLAHASAPFRLGIDDADRFATIGAVLWHLAPIPGELPVIRAGYLGRIVDKFTYYRGHVVPALRRLGWWTGGVS
jgi:Ser/Thr protein kinase RdoA (MazF antagonist)